MTTNKMQAARTITVWPIPSLSQPLPVQSVVVFSMGHLGDPCSSCRLNCRWNFPLTICCIIKIRMTDLVCQFTLPFKTHPSKSHILIQIPSPKIHTLPHSPNTNTHHLRTRRCTPSVRNDISPQEYHAVPIGMDPLLSLGLDVLSHEEVSQSSENVESLS